MPRVAGKPLRHKRVLFHADGTTSYHPLDWGPAAIRKDGTAVMCDTTGCYGSVNTLSIARTLPSTIKATPDGGRSLPAWRRRRKGGRPGQRRNTEPNVIELLEDRAEIHHKIIHGAEHLRARFVEITDKIRRMSPERLAAEYERDMRRERCEIGRALKANRGIHRVLTIGE